MADHHVLRKGRALEPTPEPVRHVVLEEAGHVPVLADQPFWSERVHRQGAAAEPIPFTRLTADRLAFALRQVLHVPSYRANARALAANVAEEDGAGAVVAAVTRL